jgi:nicotinamide-nucleotide amidase
MTKVQIAPVDALKKWFTENGRTLAFAESCTGGLLSATIAAEPGVSAFFLGSVVSYHASVKEKILKVPSPLLKVLGEVSVPTAIAMARGVKAQLKSDWAVGITGVAGPSGGSADKPVGFVCFAVVGPGFEEGRSVLFNAKERTKIQLESVQFALNFLWDSIKEK